MAAAMRIAPENTRADAQSIRLTAHPLFRSSLHRVMDRMGGCGQYPRRSPGTVEQVVRVRGGQDSTTGLEALTPLRFRRRCFDQERSCSLPIPQPD